MGKRLFNHVRVTRDDWDDVVHTEEAHVVMSVDRDGADLYALRLKQIGEDIKADQAGWKLEAKTAIRVVREEDAESLDTTEPTLLFKTRMHCELEGEWIAELPLLKVSNKDWFFLLTGELCHGGWTTELQSKAEQLGRHWYYKGRYWDKPETTHQQAPAPFCKPPKAKKRTGLAGADVLGPKTDKHRVSKPKAPAEAPGVLSTVARLGLPLQKELKISTASASSADQEPSPKSHADSQGCVAKGQVAVGNANSSLLARLLSGQFR